MFNKKSKVEEKSPREKSLELLCSDCNNVYCNASIENVEQFLCKDCIAKLIAENKKAAEKYIKEGSAGMLIFGFFWGWIKSFLYMFVAMFKGADEFGGGGGGLGGFFRFFRAVIETAFFPFVYIFRVNTVLNKKKQAEAILASDSQTQQELQDYNGEKSIQAELVKKVYQIFANCETLKSFEKSNK